MVNLVNGNGPASSAALVDSDEVDCVSFTGSTQVGVKIGEQAARTMKRTLLELGGKGACVVFEDADVKGAIGCIGSTWSFHSGQICTAPTRAVVHRSLFDQVRDGLVQMAGYLKVGDPTDTATIIGPVISAAQRGRIEAHIQTASRTAARSSSAASARPTCRPASTWRPRSSPATTPCGWPARRSSGRSSR